MLLQYLLSTAKYVCLLWIAGFLPQLGSAQCNLSPPTTNSVIQCDPGSASLQATGVGGTITWFDDSGSLAPIATGNSFTTPFLSASETYYAAVTSSSLSSWNFAANLQGWTAATQCGLNAANWAWDSDGGQGTAFAESVSGNSSMFLSSPVIDVTGAKAVDFSFIHRFNTETCCDHGYAVYRLDGGAWQRFVPTTGAYNIFDFMYNDPFLGGCGFSPDIDVFAGDNGGYQQSSGLFDLMGASTVEVGFLFTSDASFADEGWYINSASVEVICESPRVQVDVTVLPRQTAPAAVSASTCGGNSATLSASSNTSNPAPAFQWFDDVSGGNLIGSGSTFSASPTETTTYWVEELPGGPQLDRSWTFDADPEGWTLATQCDLPFNWEWNSDADRGALFANNPSGGNTSMLAISPAVNVAAFEEVFFAYNHRFNTETCCDHGYVVYRLDGGPWEVFQAGDYPIFDFMYNDPILGGCGFSPDTTVYAGDSGGYIASGGLLDVSGGTQLEVAFLYTSDASFVDEGWYINSVRLASLSNCPSERSAATLFISDTPPAPTVENQDQCLGLTSTLTAQSNSGLPNPAFEWYDAPAGGNLLASGPSYQFEPVSPTTIYVQELAQSTQNWSFATDLEGWTSTATCGFSQNWEWESDGGNGALFAQQDGSGNSSMLLQSPSVQVTGSQAVQLTYNHRYNTETCCDHGYVVYRLDGGPWEVFQAADYNIFDFMYNDPILGGCGFSPDTTVYAGDSGGYIMSTGSIPTSGAESLEVAFLYTSDASFVDEGWYINAVTIDGVAQVDCPSPRVPIAINFPDLTAPLVNDIDICPPQEPLLTAVTTSGTTNSQFEWYDAPADGNLLFVGNPFVPNPIPIANTTYYVEEVITGQRIWSFDEDLEGWSTNGECGFAETWQWIDEGGEGALFARQSGSGNSSIFLQSPVVDVSGDEGIVQLSYRHRYNTETCCDHGYVVYRLDGGPWEVFQAEDYPIFDFMYNDPFLGGCGFSPDTTVYSGDSGGYILSSGTIGVSGAASLEVGFLYTSDASFVDDAWYISEVTIDDIKSACQSPRSAAQVQVTGGLPEPSVEDIPACPNDVLDLTAVSNSGLSDPLFEWYDAPMDGNLLFSGNPYPIIAGGATTYYVEEFTTGDGYWSFDEGLEGWSANAQCDLQTKGNWENVDDGGTSALFAQQNGSGNSSMFLESPIFALDGQATIDYSFRHRFNTETCCDHGYVLARFNGGPWVQITPTTNSYNVFDFMYNDPFLGDCGFSPDILVYAGDSGGYLTSGGTLPTFGVSTLQIGFLYTSDASFVDEGWYIDEVLIEDIYPGCRSDRVALNILDQSDIPILINCPGDVLIPNDPNVCQSLVNLIPPTATDGCEGPPLMVTGTRSDGLALNQPYPVGETSVEWSATDDDDNTSTCTTTVVVIDAENPMANCNNPIIALGPDGTADLTPDLIDNNSKDNCGIISRSLDVEEVNCSDIGAPVPVTLTVEDAAGNPHTCIALVTVLDGAPPTALCQDIELPLTVTSMATLLPLQVNNGSNDNCGTVMLSVSPDQFTCDELGPNSVTLKVQDSSGNMASCQATVTVVEGLGDCNDPPVAICQNIVRTADENCLATVSPVEIDNNSFDPDGDPITFSLLPAGPYGLDVTMVTLTVTDPFGEEDSCNATIEVVDETRPTISCPASIEVDNDPGLCSANLNLPLPTADDNCGVDVLEFRYREVDNGNNPLGPWSSWKDQSQVNQTLSVGRYRVRWRAKDAAGNKRGCLYFVRVVDAEPPMISCTDQTIVFNGEASIALLISDLASATDNCGIADLSIDLDIVDCADLGMAIPVTATAVDVNGLMNNCVSTVTVDGLPCGWSQQPDGIGCEEGNEVTYDVGTEEFTVSSTDCHNPISTNIDEYAFAQYNLCGDGEIIAQVTSITGNAQGWAGIIMRESNDPQVQSVAYMTNLSANHRRETRVVYGGTVLSQLMPSFGRHWLKLQRIGNQFRAYSSFNGTIWFLRYAQYVTMADCIEVGLVVNSYVGSGDQSATFANVVVQGTTFFELLEGGSDLPALTQPNRRFRVYPNPTAGQLTIQLNGHWGQDGRLDIVDVHGQLVQTIQGQTLLNAQEMVDLSSLPAGLYLVRLQLPDGTVQTQRVILQSKP